MCTYSQLKKIYKTNMCNGDPYVPKLYSSSGVDISKFIESRIMKFITLVDNIYVCAVTNAFPCNECIFFKCFF